MKQKKMTLKDIKDNDPKLYKQMAKDWTPEMKKAVKEHGPENFSFEIIEECDDDKADERQKYWIDKHNSRAPNGYN